MILYTVHRKKKNCKVRKNVGRDDSQFFKIPAPNVFKFESSLLKKNTYDYCSTERSKSMKSQTPEITRTSREYCQSSRNQFRDEGLISGVERRLLIYSAGISMTSTVSGHVLNGCTKQAEDIIIVTHL